MNTLGKIIEMCNFYYLTTGKIPEQVVLGENLINYDMLGMSSFIMPSVVAGADNWSIKIIRSVHFTITIR